MSNGNALVYVTHYKHSGRESVFESFSNSTVKKFSAVM